MYPCADYPVDPYSLVRVGHALLARVQSVYSQAGINLPERQIWIAGEGVFDCEQLIVSFMGLREGIIGADGRSATVPSAPCDIPVIATFQITVVRCVPTPESRGNAIVPPTPEALATATDIAAVDAYLLIKSGCKFDMFGSDIQPPLDPSALGGMGVDVRVAAQEAGGGMQAMTLFLDTVIG